MKSKILLVFFLLLTFSTCKNTQLSQNTNPKKKLNPFEAYVAAPDTAYRYELRNTIKGEGFTTYILYMQSQRWLTEKEVKDPLWWHWLTVVVPDEVKSDMGLLAIGGGSRSRKLPKKTNDIIAKIALATGTITCELHNIPNQKVEFVGDDYGPRKEDELIAYGWRKFLDGGGKDEDAKWLARLPMTKAAVKAMDTVSDFCKKNTNHSVNRYTVIGASKRGWTTWTTAILDKRVQAIAPLVIDMLNVIPSFQHHWQAYGFWAPAVGNYEEEGIMDRQKEPAYQKIMDLVEPYSYLDRLTLPKYLVNATGDQFFIPDSWQFYWNDLKGEKHLRYVANTDHSLGKSDALESFVAFYNAIVTDTPRPDFEWEIKNGTIHLQTDPKFIPKSITLWQAHNTEARDFRVETIGQAWEAKKIAIRPDGKYEIAVEQPRKGWTAFFAELEFPSNGPAPFKFTTGVVVTPKDLPFEAYGN